MCARSANESGATGSRTGRIDSVGRICITGKHLISLVGYKMIVRSWRGIAKREMSDAYMAYFRETGLRDYRATPGIRRIEVLLRPTDQGVEWMLLTTWDSWDAVRAFAGETPERARYYPNDTAYFDVLPELVEHYESALVDTVGSSA